MPRTAVTQTLLRSFKKHRTLTQISNKLYHGGVPSVQTDQLISTNGIVTSPFPSVKIPKVGVVEYIWKNTSQWDDKEFITCAISGRAYTYGTARHLIDKFAQSLLCNCGLKPGDVVAMYLPNLPEYVVVSHGVLAAGLILTSVNPLFKYEELLRQFTNANVKAIVTISLFLENALKVSKQLPDYKTTICLDSNDDPIKNVKSLPKLIQSSDKTELPTIESHNLAFLPYSSGTTGMPKGVKLTHYNLVANLVQANHSELTNLTPDERFKKGLSVLPFFHIYGYNSMLNTSIIEAVHTVTLPKFTPEDYIKALENHRPEFLLVVPSLLLFLASHPAVTKDHLASVIYAFSGASLATDELAQRFREKAGREIPLRQGYGLTECSPVVTMTPRSISCSKKNSVGVLFPNTETKIIDLTTSESQGPHQAGELCVRGPQVMEGYLNNDAATKEIITEDGWLHTGDIGYYDEDGYFYIVDRCKDLIKVKGNQVSPTELETLILEIPGIADVAVIGIPDKQTGELPRAFVVKKQNVNVSEEDIHSYVNPKISSYKKLLGGIRFVNNIPRNPSGKILRNELKSIQ